VALSTLSRRAFPQQSSRSGAICDGLRQRRLKILVNLVVKLEQPLIQQHVFYFTTDQIKNESGVVLVKDRGRPCSQGMLAGI
jgi:hypothetical protein